MELKGTHASQALRLIHRSIPQLVAIASLVSTFLEKRGCNVRIPSANNLQLCSSRHRSDNERRLKWLATQVRPSVQLLIAAGCYNEVVEALGISPCGDDSSSHLN
jgi:hypothetical protein